MKRMVVFLLALVLGSAFAQNLYGLNLGMTRIQVHNILTKNGLLLTVLQEPAEEEDFAERWIYTKGGPDAYPLDSEIDGDSTSVTFDADHMLSSVHMSVATNTFCETYSQWYRFFVEKYGAPGTQNNYRSERYMGLTSCADLNVGIEAEQVRLSATWYRLNSSGEVLNTLTLSIDPVWGALNVDQKFYDPWGL